ncbi:MAG: alpha/beta hydrolase [Phycisphaerales bacterium]|nr:alpha/beta hydrolase [Phycisphaerales bacterium]
MDTGSPRADQSEKAAESPGKPRRKDSRMWFRFKWIVRALFVAFIIWGLMTGLDSFFYHPTRRVWATPDELQLACEEVQFKTRDGVTLHGWWAPAVGRPRGTIIHYHGNAENLTNHIAFSVWMPGAGYNLLIFDYRGYGKSQGSPTRAGTISDGHAALDFVLQRPEVDRSRVFLYGHSLGGAIATVVAAERPEPAALILDSTFSSYRRIAARHAQQLFGAQWIAANLSHLLVSRGFDPIDYIARVAPRPVMVITSGSDRICFPELGRELFDGAKEPKVYWEAPSVNHGEAVIDLPDETMRRINSFLDLVGGASR